MYKKVWLFLALAFGLTWGLQGTYYLAGGRLTDAAAMPMLMGSMLMPAIAAIITQRIIYKQPMTAINLRLRFNKWFGVAMLAPVLVAAGAIAIGGLMPGAVYSNGIDTILQTIDAALAQQAALTAQELASVQSQLAIFQELADNLGFLTPVALFIGFMLINVIAGATINAVFALGEELGWRGLMQAELSPLGFWRSALVIGVVWGLWHAPIIAQGYNYPQHPLLGILMMTVFTTLWTPLHMYVVERSGTVLAAAVMHGVINAGGATVLLYVSGYNDLLVGITGLAGFMALAIANVLLWLARRRIPAPVTIETPTSERAVTA